MVLVVFGSLFARSLSGQRKAPVLLLQGLILAIMVTWLAITNASFNGNWQGVCAASMGEIFLFVFLAKWIQNRRREDLDSFRFFMGIKEARLAEIGQTGDSQEREYLVKTIDWYRKMIDRLTKMGVK